MFSKLFGKKIIFAKQQVFPGNRREALEPFFKREPGAWLLA